MTRVNPIDLTAKLLATENLTVVRVNASTASFDVGTRVLYLPLWKDMTPEIEAMLVQHEVGHALFTPLDAWVQAIDQVENPREQRILKGYMNVVEDARIEKLMKRRYPGSRKSFYAGYQQLIERDFFKIKGKDVSLMKLIDRINLYFKGGISLGVSFSPEERVFVNKVDRCETVDEMIQISKEILEYAKAVPADSSRDSDAENEEDEDDLLDELDYDFEDEEFSSDFEEYQQSENSSDKEQSNASETTGGESKDDSNNESQDDNSDLEKLESETDKNLNETLEEMADSSISHRYLEIEEKSWKDNIVSYKEVLSKSAYVDEMLINYVRDFGDNSHNENFEKFIKDSDRVVSYLVKEFEMRKSAQAYKRAQTSKSGSLNMNKIHAYKITDDIFRRVTTIPDGKNHGMVFLLDWSGSMSNVIIPTIKQVINLAMFCRRINIPFEVFAFTGSYGSRNLTTNDRVNGNNFNSAMMQRRDKNILFSDGFYNLLNLFSSKMTNAEFKTAANRFTNPNIFYVSGFSLGDTPLNDALLDMLKFIPDYKNRNGIEKLTLITLTDGCGNRLHTNVSSLHAEYDSSFRVKKKYKNFVVDKMTEKTYQLEFESWSYTETLLKMIKDRYDITTLGFYICANSRHVLQSVYRDHFGKDSASYCQIDNMRKDFRQDGFFSLKGTGRDDLFIIPNTSTKIVDEELEVNSNLSAQVLAKKLSRNMGNKKNSRILLDKFIGYVS